MLRKRLELATWTWGYFPLGQHAAAVELLLQTFRMPELTSDSSVTSEKLLTLSSINETVFRKYEVFVSPKLMGNSSMTFQAHLPFGALTFCVSAIRMGQMISAVPSCPQIL